MFVWFLSFPSDNIYSLHVCICVFSFFFFLFFTDPAFIRKDLVDVMKRPGACPRLSSLSSHVLAVCAGAGEKRSKARMLDGMEKSVCRTLVQMVETDPRKAEVGQVRSSSRCSFRDCACVCCCWFSFNFPFLSSIFVFFVFRFPLFLSVSM